MNHYLTAGRNAVNGVVHPGAATRQCIRWTPLTGLPAGCYGLTGSICLTAIVRTLPGRHHHLGRSKIVGEAFSAYPPLATIDIRGATVLAGRPVGLGSPTGSSGAFCRFRRDDKRKTPKR
jgi:hypothetical protein